VLRESEVAPVRTAPQADTIRVDVRSLLEVQPGAEGVLELAGPARSILQRLSEFQSVPDAAPVVDGEHDVALTGEVLVEGIRVVVVDLRRTSCRGNKIYQSARTTSTAS
jgi:hypothetical protein